MKNKHIEAVRSKVKLSITGKNVNRYLLRLAKNRIPLLSVDKKTKDTCFVLIYFKDYEEIQKLNTIYDIVNHYEKTFEMCYFFNVNITNYCS